MRVRTGLKHPLGLTLLILSLLMAAAVTLFPQLGGSTRALWLVIVGLLAYLASVVVVVLVRARIAHEALDKLRTIRNHIARTLAELKAEGGHGRSSALVPVVEQAVGHVDGEILPKLEQIVVRHRRLTRQLEWYKNGVLPQPEDTVMKRLDAIHTGQKEAIDACVKQASNAYGILVVLTQESDEARVASEARMWAADLTDLHEGLVEALSRKDDLDDALEKLQRTPADARPIVQDLDRALETLPPEEVETAPVRLQVPPDRTFPDGLTPREVEVLGLIANGMTAREMAEQMVLAVPTVQRHIQNIYGKIDARGRADATRYWLKHFKFPQAVDARGDGAAPAKQRDQRVS